MGAILTDKVPVLEILKPTGYNCPEELMDKTWGDVTKSGGASKLYAWGASVNKCYTLSATPAVGDKAFVGEDAGPISAVEIEAVGDEYATITTSNGTYDRYPDGDLTL